MKKPNLFRYVSLNLKNEILISAYMLISFIKDELGGEEYKDKELFLFNLDSDPTEKINLASSLPEVVKQLEVKP